MNSTQFICLEAWMGVKTVGQIARDYPVHGSRRLRVLLRREGQQINRKRGIQLLTVMDWWSRYALEWEWSNSLDSEFCIWV